MYRRTEYPVARRNKDAPCSAGRPAARQTAPTVSGYLVPEGDEKRLIAFSLLFNDFIEEIANARHVVDGIFVDEGPNGQGKASFTNLWMVTLADKQMRQLTTGDRIIGDFEPSRRLRSSTCM